VPLGGFRAHRRRFATQGSFRPPPDTRGVRRAPGGVPSGPVSVHAAVLADAHVVADRAEHMLHSCPGDRRQLLEHLPYDTAPRRHVEHRWSGSGLASEERTVRVMVESYGDRDKHLFPLVSRRVTTLGSNSRIGQCRGDLKTTDLRLQRTTTDVTQQNYQLQLTGGLHHACSVCTKT
jgi:hypothetical protein